MIFLKPSHNQKTIPVGLKFVLRNHILPFLIVLGAESWKFLMIIFVGGQQTNNEITFLLRLLSLGVGAWDMIDKQAFKEQPVVISSIYDKLYF